MRMMLRNSVVVLLLMIFVIPQSFMFIKLPFLSFAVIGVAAGLLYGTYKINNLEFFLYYCLFSLMTAVWCIVGLINGNPTIAVIEAIRVYIVYMWVYFAIAIYISSKKYHEHVDQIIFWASIGIGITALYVLADYVFGLGWLNQDIVEEMYLQAGVGDGYVQMNNINIGMLAFIVPYLLSRVLFEHAGSNRLLHVGLFVAFTTALLASRRMVLLLAFLTPMITYGVCIVGEASNKAIRQRVIWFYLISAVIVVIGYWIVSLWSPAMLDGFMDRLLGMFRKDPDSERQLQHAALLEGFTNHYMWGSGFGGLTDVVRSDERPWTYELTYSRLLFNSGVIGIALLGLFFVSYFIMAMRKIRVSKHKNVYVPLLVGFVSVLIASASNPYLSSFDFLFALSIIPLILNSREESSSDVRTIGDRA